MYMKIKEPVFSGICLFFGSVILDTKIKTVLESEGFGSVSVILVRFQFFQA